MKKIILINMFYFFLFFNNSKAQVSKNNDGEIDSIKISIIEQIEVANKNFKDLISIAVRIQNIDGSYNNRALNESIIKSKISQCQNLFEQALTQYLYLQKISNDTLSKVTNKKMDSLVILLPFVFEDLQNRIDNFFDPKGILQISVGQVFLEKYIRNCSKEFLNKTELVTNSEIKYYSSTGNVTDAGGNTYKTVKIGNQWWMAENLNYKTNSGSWCYGDKSSNCEVYGRLYTWEVAKKVCPSGWHLPSDKEWSKLTDFLGGEGVAGGKMKEVGSSHWESPNIGADNSSGFNALPGGYYSFGYFDFIGIYGCWWSAKRESEIVILFRKLHFRQSGVERSGNNPSYGLSVRCVKD